MKYILKIKVIPGAKKSEIVNYQENILKIRIHASPEKGKANKALIAFLAKYFHLAQKDISITSGHTGRLKSVHIEIDDIKKIEKVLGNIQ